MEAVLLLVPLMLAMWLVVWLLAVLSGAVVGFFEMLALGVLHHTVNSHIPALGFFSCWILTIGLMLLMLLIGGGVKPTMNKSTD